MSSLEDTQVSTCCFANRTEWDWCVPFANGTEWGQCVTFANGTEWGQCVIFANGTEWDKCVTLANGTEWGSVSFVRIWLSGARNMPSQWVTWRPLKFLKSVGHMAPTEIYQVSGSHGAH